MPTSLTVTERLHFVESWTFSIKEINGAMNEVQPLEYYGSDENVTNFRKDGRHSRNNTCDILLYDYHVAFRAGALLPNNLLTVAKPRRCKIVR